MEIYCQIQKKKKPAALRINAEDVCGHQLLQSEEQNINIQ